MAQVKLENLSVAIRSPEAHEIPKAVDVFATTLVDYWRRHGKPDTGFELRDFWEDGYQHILRTGIIRIADTDGQIVAVCCGVVRSNIWFLSGFWCLPSYHGKGIGSRLIRKVWEQAAQAGASIFFTWSTIDLQAMATYMKVGLLPGYQMLKFTGSPKTLATAQDFCTTEALSPELAVHLEEPILGISRKIDHQFWSNRDDYLGRQVLVSGKTAGYFYVSDGFVGPAGWTDNAHAEIVINAAVQAAVEQCPQDDVTLFIPGINHAAIRHALKLGLRLDSFSNLLFSAEFGKLQQYLSSGPLLF